MFINSLKCTLMVALSAVFIPFFGHAKMPQDFSVNKVDEHKYTVSLTSFDGSALNARLQLPDVVKSKYPVLISIHGMARSQNRVWLGEYKGGKTLESTHKITENALNKGFAVLAIDARYHGERKVEEIGLVEILKELESQQYNNYNRMILDTVADYKVLISQLDKVEQLDTSNIQLVGYSMGAQMALLVAGQVPAVKHVYAMVPPGVAAKRAEVSPIANAHKITNAEVMLFTANQDQYATQAENAELFNNLGTSNKLMVEFDADHLLPEHYVQVLNKLWSL